MRPMRFVSPPRSHFRTHSQGVECQAKLIFLFCLFLFFFLIIQGHRVGVTEVKRTPLNISEQTRVSGHHRYLSAPGFCDSSPAPGDALD